MKIRTVEEFEADLDMFFGLMALISRQFKTDMEIRAFMEGMNVAGTVLRQYMSDIVGLEKAKELHDAAGRRSLAEHGLTRQDIDEARISMKIREVFDDKQKEY